MKNYLILVVVACVCVVAESYASAAITRRHGLPAHDPKLGMTSPDRAPNNCVSLVGFKPAPKELDAPVSEGVKVLRKLSVLLGKIIVTFEYLQEKLRLKYVSVFLEHMRDVRREIDAAADSLKNATEVEEQEIIFTAHESMEMVTRWFIIVTNRLAGVEDIPDDIRRDIFSQPGKCRTKGGAPQDCVVPILLHLEKGIGDLYDWLITISMSSKLKAKPNLIRSTSQGESTNDLHLSLLKTDESLGMLYQSIVDVVDPQAVSSVPSNINVHALRRFIKRTQLEVKALDGSLGKMDELTRHEEIVAVILRVKEVRQQSVAIAYVLAAGDANSRAVGKALSVALPAVGNATDDLERTIHKPDWVYVVVILKTMGWHLISVVVVMCAVSVVKRLYQRIRARPHRWAPAQTPLIISIMIDISGVLWHEILHLIIEQIIRVFANTYESNKMLAIAMFIMPSVVVHVVTVVFNAIFARPRPHGARKHFCELVSHALLHLAVKGVASFLASSVPRVN